MPSKYDPLRAFLATQQGSVTLTFDQIERLGIVLPAAARTYPEWWANEDPKLTRHVQCRAWRSLGRTATPHLTAKTVTFS
jgi:hypothetical protein